MSEGALSAFPDSLVHLVGTILIAVIGGVIRDLRKSRVAFRAAFNKRVGDLEQRVAYLEGRFGI